MKPKSARCVRWVAVPIRDGAEHHFPSAEEAAEWVAQPICKDAYRVVPMVMAKCGCCGTFHIKKPSESVAEMLRVVGP